MIWFSLESPVVERKYVFTGFTAENDLSLTALVAGMPSNSFPIVKISLTSFLRELSRDFKKVFKSLTSDSEVSNPIVVCGKSKSCPFNLQECKSSLYIFTTWASSVSHGSLAKDFNRSSCMFTKILKASCSNLVGGDAMRYSIYRIKVGLGEFQESSGCPVLQLRA